MCGPFCFGHVTNKITNITVRPSTLTFSKVLLPFPPRDASTFLIRQFLRQPKDLLVLHAHVFIEETVDLFLRLEQVGGIRSEASESDAVIDEHVSPAHDQPVGVDHGVQLHQSGEELEGGIGLARQHVADGGVAEVDGLSKLVCGDPVVVEHLLQPVG